VAKVFVIVGPAGVGKGTLVQKLRQRLPEISLAVSATTRTPRPGELDGEHYHFLTREEFERRVVGGDFVEHAEYAGNRYGTLRSELEGRLEAGQSVLLEIELQGARQLREALPQAVTVFIAPPTTQALRARLMRRGTDSPEQIAARLQAAELELAAQPEFEHVVVNDHLEDAVRQLVAVVERELDGSQPAGSATEGS
jgi:guanylate kinase